MTARLDHLFQPWGARVLTRRPGTPGSTDRSPVSPTAGPPARGRRVEGVVDQPWGAQASGARGAGGKGVWPGPGVRVPTRRPGTPGSTDRSPVSPTAGPPARGRRVERVVDQPWGAQAPGVRGADGKGVWPGPRARVLTRRPGTPGSTDRSPVSPTAGPPARGKRVEGVVDQPWGGVLSRPSVERQRAGRGHGLIGIVLELLEEVGDRSPVGQYQIRRDLDQGHQYEPPGRDLPVRQ
jgi:hypothetical protein